MARLFTHAEAESLIPQVERLLRDALALKSEHDDADRGLREFAERIMLMGGILVDRAKAAEVRNRLTTADGRLRGVLEQIQETGCLIKDLDTGLVDFPTRFRGVEVYLCWKLGETSIRFWHGIDEGFRGRKEIDRDFLDHHEGDPPQ